MAAPSPDMTTLGQLTGYRLRRASAVFAADFAAALDGSGVRQTPLGILSVVADNPGISQGAVGRLLGVRRANMVPLINDLIETGLIVRETDPGDRRAFSLMLSPAGRVLLDDCLRRIGAHERRMLAGFSPAEQALLLELLERIERSGMPAD